MLFFFFNDTATTEIYTLSLHDALPIFTLGHALQWAYFGFIVHVVLAFPSGRLSDRADRALAAAAYALAFRSEEHTSELQSAQYLDGRLLLEKKNMHLPLLVMVIGLRDR